VIERGTPAAHRENPSAPASPAGLAPLRHIEVVLGLVAAPVLLLLGVPAVGYGIGLGAWILLRFAGVAVEQRVGGTPDVTRQVTLRLGYRLARVFLLALAIILARNTAGKQDGLTALLLITVAFTVQLGLSIVDRP
jgi:hypothetical protein